MLLENIGETLRFALNSLAAVAPDWLQQILPDDDWDYRGSVSDFKKIGFLLLKKNEMNWP